MKLVLFEQYEFIIDIYVEVENILPFVSCIEKNAAQQAKSFFSSLLLFYTSLPSSEIKRTLKVFNPYIYWAIATPPDVDFVIALQKQIGMKCIPDRHVKINGETH